ncbi:MAG: divalent-cation tolerance protein CutA [Thauera sp.]|nr:divalent-cation tolerance protein CutA [Thauera sp.]
MTASPGNTTLIVLTNLPDEAAARALAERLIAERLAACVNLLAACTSVYRWRGAVESAREVPLLIKTTTERYAALQAAILDAHPYELPEIVAVPVQQVFAPFAKWVADETRPLPPGPDDSAP